MKLIVTSLAAVAMLSGATAAAAAATDVEYLRANRCLGLAQSGVVEADSSALEAFVKAEARTRVAFVLDRGKAELDKARREGKTDNAERKARLSAELAGPCQAFKP